MAKSDKVCSTCGGAVEVGFPDGVPATRVKGLTWRHSDDRTPLCPGQGSAVAEPRGRS